MVRFSPILPSPISSSGDHFQLYFGFFCHEAKLAVELDGSQHCDPLMQQYDAQRTAHMQNLGITVVHFSNRDVMNNFSGVCQFILQSLENQGCHPSVACGDSSPQGSLERSIYHARHFNESFQRLRHH